jgi:hypothetical protein
MWTLYDPDEYEMVSHSVPCTHCGGDFTKCRGGMCNGSAGAGMRRRKPEDIARIRAERLRREEDEILARADAILARRNQ